MPNNKICQCEKTENIERYLSQFGFCPTCGGVAEKLPSAEETEIQPEPETQPIEEPENHCEVCNSILDDHEMEICDACREDEEADYDDDEDYGNEDNEYEEECECEDCNCGHAEPPRKRSLLSRIKPHHFKWGIVPMYPVDSAEKARKYNRIVIEVLSSIAIGVTALILILK